MASKVLVLLSHSWARSVYLDTVASGRLPALLAIVRAVLPCARSHASTGELTCDKGIKKLASKWTMRCKENITGLYTTNSVVERKCLVQIT